MIVLRPTKNNNCIRIYFFDQPQNDIGILFIASGQLAVKAILMNLIIDSKKMDHFLWTKDSIVHKDYNYVSINHNSTMETIAYIKHVAISNDHLFKLLPY